MTVIHLHKLLPILVSPAFIVVVLAILSLCLRAKWPRILLLIVLLITTSPLVSLQTTKLAERGYTRLPADAVNTAESIVVLGGMTRTIAGPNGTLVYEFTNAADRLLAGITLIHNDKGKRLILTRGHLPWSLGVPEGEFLAQVAQELGVARDRITLTSQAHNTAQEVDNIMPLLENDESVILVTSAYHMPRALALFRQKEVNVTPFPVDFRSTQRRRIASDLLPSAEAFFTISLMSREFLGRAYYWLRAKIAA